MTETLESELRTALAERAESLPVRAVVERLQEVDYSPRTRPRLRWLPARLPVWPVLGGAAAAVVAAVVAAVLLLSSGTTAAYAGWTPTPTTPTSAQVAAATAACNWIHSTGGAPPALTGTPVLTDQRGRFTAAIYVVGIHVHNCLSDGSHDSTVAGMNEAQLNLYARPGPDQLGLPDNSGGTLKGFLGGSANEPLPLPWQARLDSPGVKNDPSTRARLEAEFKRMLASGIERNAFGLAGSHVSAVVFDFSDGTTVDATVQNGWYFAWWPSLNYPTSVQVTTTSGTMTSPMMPTGGQGPGCVFGASGCVWAGLQPRHGAPTGAPTTTTSTSTTGNTTSPLTTTTPTTTTTVTTSSPTTTTTPTTSTP